MNFYKYADYRPCRPFETAEHAWFWCCFCESKKESKEHRAGKDWGAPCETSDILIVLKRLVHAGKITQQHLKTLSKFGLLQAPPHPLFGASLYECRLWKEAMDAFFEPLLSKGIIESPQVGESL